MADIPSTEEYLASFKKGSVSSDVEPRKKGASAKKADDSALRGFYQELTKSDIPGAKSFANIGRAIYKTPGELGREDIPLEQKLLNIAGSLGLGAVSSAEDIQGLALKLMQPGGMIPQDVAKQRGLQTSLPQNQQGQIQAFGLPVGGHAASDAVQKVIAPLQKGQESVSELSQIAGGTAPFILAGMAPELLGAKAAQAVAKTGLKELVKGTAKNMAEGAVINPLLAIGGAAKRGQEVTPQELLEAGAAGAGISLIAHPLGAGLGKAGKKVKGLTSKKAESTTPADVEAMFTEADPRSSVVPSATVASGDVSTQTPSINEAVQAILSAYKSPDEVKLGGPMRPGQPNQRGVLLQGQGSGIPEPVPTSQSLPGEQPVLPSQESLLPAIVPDQSGIRISGGGEPLGLPGPTPDQSGVMITPAGEIVALPGPPQARGLPGPSPIPLLTTGAAEMPTLPQGVSKDFAGRETYYLPTTADTLGRQTVRGVSGIAPEIRQPTIEVLPPESPAPKAVQVEMEAPAAQQPKAAQAKKPLPEGVTEEPVVYKGGKARDAEKLLLPEDQWIKVTDGTGRWEEHKMSMGGGRGQGWTSVNPEGYAVFTPVGSKGGLSAAKKAFNDARNAEIDAGGGQPAEPPKPQSPKTAEPPREPVQSLSPAQTTSPRQDLIARLTPERIKDLDAKVEAGKIPSEFQPDMSQADRNEVRNNRVLSAAMHMAGGSFEPGNPRWSPRELSTSELLAKRQDYVNKVYGESGRYNSPRIDAIDAELLWRDRVMNGIEQARAQEIQRLVEAENKGGLGNPEHVPDEAVLNELYERWQEVVDREASQPEPKVEPESKTEREIPSELEHLTPERQQQVVDHIANGENGKALQILRADLAERGIVGEEAGVKAREVVEAIKPERPLPETKAEELRSEMPDYSKEQQDQLLGHLKEGEGNKFRQSVVEIEKGDQAKFSKGEKAIVEQKATSLWEKLKKRFGPTEESKKLDKVLGKIRSTYEAHSMVAQQLEIKLKEVAEGELGSEAKRVWDNLSAEDILVYTANALDSDHIRRYDPTLAAAWEKIGGDIIQTWEGVDKIKPGTKEWASAEKTHNMTAREIETSKDLHLSKEQRQAIIETIEHLKQEKALFSEALKKHIEGGGNADSGIGKLLSEKATGIERVAGKVEWLDQLQGSAYANAVTGNYHIHSLHFADWVTMSPAYLGIRNTLQAAKYRATNPAVWKWATQGGEGVFSRNKGGQTLGGKIVSEIGKKVPGVKKGVDWIGRRADEVGELVPSPVRKLGGKIGSVIEGGWLEGEKNGLTRIAAALKIAKDYGINGDRLLNALAAGKGSSARSILTPEQWRNVYGELYRIGTEMHGLTAPKMSNRTPFRRTVGSLGRYIEPFVTMAALQSRMITKNAADGLIALKKGDFNTAGTKAGRIITHMATHALLAGSAGTMPNEIEELVRRMDPKLAITARRFLQSVSEAGRFLTGGRQIAHLKPSLFPFLWMTFDNVGEMAGIGADVFGANAAKRDKALAKVGSLLVAGHGIFKYASPQQISHFLKIFESPDEETGRVMKTLFIRRKNPFADRLIKEQKMETNAVRELFDYVFPHYSAEEAMVNLNAQNVNDVTNYIAGHVAEGDENAMKYAKEDLRDLWEEYSDPDTGEMTEIPLDRLSEIMELYTQSAEEAPELERVAPAEIPTITPSVAGKVKA